MKRISLWLIPCEKDYVLLDKKIQEIKNEFNGSELFPHLSLPFSLSYNFEEIVTRLNQNKFNKFKLCLSSIGQGDKIHQQVFFKFKQNDYLENLTSDLKILFDDLIVKKRNVFPHLSLVYSDNVGLYSKEEKDKISSKIGKLDVIQFDRIVLVDLSSNKTKNWKIIKEINLI